LSALLTQCCIDFTNFVWVMINHNYYEEKSTFFVQLYLLYASKCPGSERLKKQWYRHMG